MTDELETIRTRHEADDKTRQYIGFLDAPAALRAARQAHADRATLLRALDEALAKLERYDDALDEIAAHYNGGITGPGRLQADSMRDIARAALKEPGQ